MHKSAAGKAILAPNMKLVTIEKGYLFDKNKKKQNKNLTDIAPDRSLNVYISRPNKCVDPMHEIISN